MSIITLGMRVSDICAAHDGEIIEVKNAVPGVNIPPLHPWCRSAAIGLFDVKYGAGIVDKISKMRYNESADKSRYVADEIHKIKTVFSKEDFDPTTRAVMEVF